MLYTVSGVQILAILDAFGELDERVKDGRMKIGKCTPDYQFPICNITLMKRSYCEPAGS